MKRLVKHDGDNGCYTALDNTHSKYKPQTTGCLELWSAKRHVLTCTVLGVVVEAGLGGSSHTAKYEYTNTIHRLMSSCPYFEGCLATDWEKWEGQMEVTSPHSQC